MFFSVMDSIIQRISLIKSNPLLEREKFMHDKKAPTVVSPDLTRLKAVIIDRRTTIYIDKDSNSNDARILYEERRQAMNLKLKSSGAEL